MIVLLVILALFVVVLILGLCALRYGYDSRERIPSAGEQRGAQGLRWPSPATEQADHALADGLQAARQARQARAAAESDSTP